jgi:glutaredoxin-like protein
VCPGRSDYVGDVTLIPEIALDLSDRAAPQTIAAVPASVAEPADAKRHRDKQSHNTQSRSGNCLPSPTVEVDMTTPITMYGADWCGDCRRSKKLLDTMGIDYEYIDVEAIESAADAARAISGRTNIPVVAFPDGTHFVEPSDAALRAKVEALQSA